MNGPRDSMGVNRVIKAIDVCVGEDFEACVKTRVLPIPGAEGGLGDGAQPPNRKWRELRTAETSDWLTQVDVIIRQYL